LLPHAIRRKSHPPTGGHFDLEAGILHRKSAKAAESNKRAPRCRIHHRLRLLLRYWKKADLAKGVVYAIHYQGKPIKTKLRRSWDTIRREAGHEAKDGAHILRHSCATDLMRRGVPIFEAAGYLGMSAATLESVYGHHHPDFQAGAADVGHIQVTSIKRMNRTGTR
jgi:integrase